MPNSVEESTRPRTAKGPGFWTREVVLTTSSLFLIFFFLGTYILRFFLGFWFYYLTYIPAALGSDETEYSCYRILREEGNYPLSTLSWEDWLWFKRCQGSRDGFDIQGQIWSTVKEWAYNLAAPVVRMSPWPTFSLILLLLCLLSSYQNTILYKIYSLRTPLLQSLERSWSWIFWSGSLFKLFVWDSKLSYPQLVMLTTISGGNFIYAWMFSRPDLLNIPFITLFRNLSPRLQAVLSLILQCLPISRNELPKQGNCIHSSSCCCFFQESSTVVNLQGELNRALDREGLAQEEKNRVFMKLVKAEEQRDRYQLDAEKCHKYHWTPLSPRVETPRPITAELRRIEQLERIVTDLKSQNIRQEEEYKKLISQLQTRICSAQSTSADVNIKQAELDTTRSRAEDLEKEIEVLLARCEDLRGELQFEKENHSQNCRNETWYQKEIKEWKEKAELLLSSHREYDQIAREAAKVLGVKDDVANQITLLEYLEEITFAMLRTKGIGEPEHLSTDSQGQPLELMMEKGTGNMRKLGREEERRGGDVNTIELGIDTTKPRPTGTKLLTYRENADRVFLYYDKVFDMLIMLENLYTLSNLPTPPWIIERGRDDLIYLTPGHSHFFDDPAGPLPVALGTGQVVKRPKYPTFEHADILCEKLIWAEMQRLYNRCVQLGTDIRKHASFVLQSSPNGPIDPLVSRADAVLSEIDKVLRQVLSEVLDYIPSLHTSLPLSSASQESDSRLLKKLEIHNAMTISIVELTRLIRENQREQPLWAPPPRHLLPNHGKNRQKNVDSLKANLMVQEISTLEARIIQLLVFLQVYEIPGTLMGPTLLKFQLNPSYERRYVETVVAKSFAELAINHFKVYAAQQKTKVIDERGVRNTVWVPKNELLPLKWEEFRRAGLGLKEAVVKKEQEEGEWPRYVSVELVSDGMRGPIIRFKAEEGPDMVSEQTHILPSYADSPYSIHPSLVAGYDPNRTLTPKQQLATYTQNVAQAAREYEQEKKKNEELRQRIRQLKNWIIYYNIGEGVVLPHVDEGLVKGVAMEFVRSQNIEYQGQVHVLTQVFPAHGKAIPRLVKKGGKMFP